VSIHLEEIRRKFEREHENGTLGNVQGNIGGDSLEKLSRSITGGGILKESLIDQCSFLLLSPVPLSTKEKAQHGSRQPPATLGFLDIFYCSWTVFIFPGRDLFAVDKVGEGNESRW
jgi:hypothetical protein